MKITLYFGHATRVEPKARSRSRSRRASCLRGEINLIPKSSESQADYFKNLDLVKKRILANSKLARSKKFLSPNDIETWRKIFLSFDSFSVPKKVSGISVADWNPVSQRAFVDRKPAISANLIQNFNEIAKLADNIIIDIHESLHVLLLEPFFVGRQKFSARRQLQECYFSIEAFAFWYCDFILTPQLKLELPDAEVLYSSSTVSSPRFSPVRAMRAIGIKNKTIK